MIQERDTYFYVGTMHQHPNRWIILGLFTRQGRQREISLTDRKIAKDKVCHK
jgi:hypothetical protein